MQSRIDIHRKEQNNKRMKPVTDHYPFGFWRCKLNRQAGFTLTEVLAAVAVSTIIIGMAAVAIFTFYTKYRDLSAFSKLQQEAFDAIETMKYGYAFDRGNDVMFMGIANSRSVYLETAGGLFGEHSSIICYPTQIEEGTTHDYVRYYYDRSDRAIKVQSLQGIRFYQDQIFPTDESGIEVTRLRFDNLTDNENPRIIGVELEARINISEDNWRYVTYRTNIALGR